MSCHAMSCNAGQQDAAVLQEGVVRLSKQQSVQRTHILLHLIHSSPELIRAVAVGVDGVSEAVVDHGRDLHRRHNDVAAEVQTQTINVCMGTFPPTPL